MKIISNTLTLDLKTFFSIFFLLILNSPNNIIQQIPHRRIAQIQILSHIFEASAIFDELQYKLLVVERKARQRRQFIQTGNFGLAVFAFQALDLEVRLATWTDTWQHIVEIFFAKIEYYFNLFQVWLNFFYFWLIFFER